MCNKNNCQTISHYDELGRPILKNKVKYPTHDKAVHACKTLNLRQGQIRKLVTYKCKVCHTYHIGRNKTIVSSKYRKKLRYENDRAGMANRKIQFKITGKIDFSNAIEYSWKDKLRELN